MSQSPTSPFSKVPPPSSGGGPPAAQAQSKSQTEEPKQSGDPGSGNHSSWIKEHPWWTLGIGIGLLFLVAYLISKSSACKTSDGKQKDSFVCNAASDIASIPEGIGGAILGAAKSLLWFIGDLLVDLGLVYVGIKLVRFMGGKTMGEAFASDKAIEEAAEEGDELSVEVTEDGDAFWAKTNKDGTKEPLTTGDGQLARVTEKQVEQASERAKDLGGNNAELVNRLNKAEARASEDWEMTPEEAKEKMENEETEGIEIKEPVEGF